MSILSMDVICEILKNNEDKAKEMSPLMFKIVKTKNFKDIEHIVSEIELDIANENFDHISTDHFDTLIDFCRNHASEVKFYKEIEEVKKIVDKLRWLKKRYLWVKLNSNVIAAAKEVEAYLPDDKKSLAWIIDDLYLGFLCESNVDFDGNLFMFDY